MIPPSGMSHHALTNVISTITTLLNRFQREYPAITTTLPAKLTYQARTLTFMIVPSERDRFAISNEVEIKIDGEKVASNAGYGLKGEVFCPPLAPSMRMNALVFHMNEAEIETLQK